MDNVLLQMLNKYSVETISDKKNSIKEIMQEIVLCGLSRSNFFNHAAFYGGTALRIFYGLDRFSEDLDFSLQNIDANFDLNHYLPALEKEVRSYGIHVDIAEKVKTRQSQIQSTFLKGDTKTQILTFFNESIDAIPKNEMIKVKLEVDVNPPAFASFESKFQLVPIPYQITLYDKQSLFAGKLHAVICRSWKNRVKGRDLYDYVFYLANNIPFNLKHFQARLMQSGFSEPNGELTLEKIKAMLKERFASIDYKQAKEDVLPFIKNPQMLDLWSEAFFVAITDNLTCV